MSSRKRIYVLGGLAAILILAIGVVFYVRVNTHTIPAAVAISAQPVTQPTPGWNSDPYGIRGSQPQEGGWNLDPYAIGDGQLIGVIGNGNGGEANLSWLLNLGKILILTILVLFVSMVLSVSRAREHGEFDSLSMWLGGVLRVIFGPDPRPSPWLWVTNLVVAIAVAVVVFFFWSDILVLCLIPVAIVVAALFWLGKGALVGEALEGIFTGVIIKRIVHDAGKDAEEARYKALAKAYKDLEDNDETVNPEREKLLKERIAILEKKEKKS